MVGVVAALAAARAALGPRRPRATARRRCRVVPFAGFLVCCLATIPCCLFGWRRWPSQQLLFAATVATSDSPGGGDECSKLLSEALASLQPQLVSWETAANRDQRVIAFGRKANRFVNKTLANFDSAVGNRVGKGACATQRASLHEVVERRLHAVFLQQRSIIEQELFQQLRKDLLQRMRRKHRELSVTEKLRMLHSALDDYDSRVKNFQPAFIVDSERSLAEKRLSKLQHGITETPEAKEMLQKWKMEKLMRQMPRQSKSMQPTFTPSLRIMLRPQGFGNLQAYGKTALGNMEVSVGLLNDGTVADIYNNKPNPPFTKVQLAFGSELRVH